MKLEVRKTIGNNTYAFTFEGKDLHECLMESQKLSFHDIMKCGKCDSPYIKLFAYLTKEKNYKYVKVVCGKCRASVTLGQSSNDNAYYYRKDKETKELDWQTYDG